MWQLQCLAQWWGSSALTCRWRRRDLILHYTLSESNWKPSLSEYAITNISETHDVKMAVCTNMYIICQGQIQKYTTKLTCNTNS